MCCMDTGRQRSGRQRRKRPTEDAALESVIPGVARKTVAGVAYGRLGVAAHVITVMQAWIETLVHICTGVSINY